jgi:aminobenzoyl-glutamate utilization protein B
MKRLAPIVFTALLATGASHAAAPSPEELKAQGLREVDAQQTLTQQIVDQIFSFSELGFQEIETSRYLTAMLEKNGFKVEREVAGVSTAWVATWGSGKPVIGFMTDIDCIPRASQKPGVAYRAPLVEGAPGHGEGHNSGMAVNVTAALVLKKLMQQHGLPGTLRLYPGVAEELLATKTFYVRAGLFKDVDAVLGAHVSDQFGTGWGQKENVSGLVSVQYTFKGQAAHAAMGPWLGKSALDAVELMDTAWNFRREHLRPQQRSHYVIVNGGEQPNVVPSEAAVWYYFREVDYDHIRENFESANTIADAVARITGTTVTRRVLGSAWPMHFNRPIAEAQARNVALVGMPQWSEADQTLARALQEEIGAPVEGLKPKVEELRPPKDEKMGGVSDDIGDVSWNVPTVYLLYPANIPKLPGHSWENAVAMATPIAHKGSTAGAKVQVATALDLLLSPELRERSWAYFHDVQTKDQKYVPLVAPEDMPAVEMNKEKMARFLPELRKLYYDPARYRTYLEQLGITYPTVR